MGWDSEKLVVNSNGKYAPSGKVMPPNTLTFEFLGALFAFM